MSKLKFKSCKALVKLAERTLISDKFKIAYSKETEEEKSFFLVKDEGIYVMNAYLKKAGDGTPKECGTVAYAESFDPSDDPNDDLWDRTHDISGDDFAFNLYLNDRQLINLVRGGDLTVNLKEDCYEVTA